MDTTLLDLYNFESADDSRYVLTSPRSLEACARLNTKPVELLSRPYSEFVSENNGKSSDYIKILYDDFESKRVVKLQRCRKEREKIAMEQRVKKGKKSKGNNSEKMSNSSDEELTQLFPPRSPKTPTYTSSNGCNHPTSNGHQQSHL
jgi:hypothetical protein